jgi:ABC-type uncharacterized transport system permease subunit
MIIEAIALTFNWYIIFGLLVLAAFAALRVGVFCLAIEAILLNSAFGYAIAGHLHNSLWSAMSWGLICGFSTVVLFYLLVVQSKLDEIVTGIAINIMSAGLTSFIVYRINASDDVQIIKLLSATQNRALYLVLIVSSIISIVAAVLLLSRSVYKARLISVGIIPELAVLSDVSVSFYKLIGLTICGGLASLAGIYFSAVQSSISKSEWQHGLGYLAIGVAFASSGSIVWGLFIAGGLAFFRTVSISSYLFAQFNVPETLLEISPYLFVLLAVVITYTIEIFQSNRKKWDLG